MEDNIQIKKPKKTKLQYSLIYATVPIILIIIFAFTNKEEEKKEVKQGLASALYKGDFDKDGKYIPPKLQWQDSFKKIDNMDK